MDSWRIGKGRAQDKVKGNLSIAFHGTDSGSCKSIQETNSIKWEDTQFMLNSLGAKIVLDHFSPWKTVKMGSGMQKVGLLSVISNV